MSIPSARAAKANRLLAALPRDEFERILPDLQLKSVIVRQVLRRVMLRLRTPYSFFRVWPP